MLEYKKFYKLYTIIKRKKFAVILVNCNKFIYFKIYKNLHNILNNRNREQRRIMYLFVKVLFIRRIA